MVYFIRAKSYYRYALDLYKDLPHFLKKPEDLKRKAQEIFKIGLKAIWSLSQINPPEKPPSLEELWKKTLESVEPEDVDKLKNIKNILFSEEKEPEKIIKTVETFLEIIKKNIQPIL
ncbi:hypothetical protein [Thermodesulfobacterium hydrogeniphilum]|uniref:hypothetical protein n=1 Tax=Thermodesulfobacterium hydrogeniphilum TaxID=161156 RepID=UPI0005717B11|nr:hypothetical protein [Thermodesulfobacterium hydrogeniphilum]